MRHLRRTFFTFSARLTDFFSHRLLKNYGPHKNLAFTTLTGAIKINKFYIFIFA